MLARGICQVDWDVAIRIPGVTLTPNGKMQTGEVNGQVIEALEIGTQRYHVFLEGQGISEPGFARTTSPYAKIPPYIQSTQAFFCFSWTTPGGASWRDSRFTGYTTVVIDIHFPVGAKLLLEKGQVFRKGAKIQPYLGHPGLDIRLHYEKLKATHIGEYVRGEKTRPRRMLNIQFRAELPSSALFSEGYGVRGRETPLPRLEEIWGVPFFMGDIRDIMQVGAGVHAGAPQEFVKKIWGEVSSDFGYKEATRWREWLANHLEVRWAKEPSLYRRDDPLTQARVKAGVLREQKPEDLPEGYEQAPPPEGTFWGYAEAIGLELPTAVQHFALDLTNSKGPGS